MAGQNNAASPPETSSPGRRGFFLLGLPSWFVLLLLVLPLVTGARTLFYRDVASTHLPLKSAQTQLLESADAGWPGPLVDPYRGGGQPWLGNPNAVPFYPTNVLYRVADPLWALNAHFWVHWLLAPFAGFWLGRSWRLTRPGAWACGVAWATGGYVMSLLNLYNMVALAVLAPATIAAFVDLARSTRPGPRRRMATAAVLTGLTFLGGDPASAALVYVLAAAAFCTAASSRSVPAVRGILQRALPAVALGLLLAAPVLVEMLRILPNSYRGLWRYETQSVLAQSWHPSTLLDWFIPGFFGRLDLSFWGGSVFGGNPPFLSSVFPGWIVLALAAVAGFRWRGRHVWAWGALLGGVFLALGGHNPTLSWLAESADFGLLRYPVKAWLAAALGLSVLAGLGFERLWRGRGSRGVFALVLLFAAGGIVWIRAQLHADSSLVRWAVELSAGRLTGAALDAELARWGTLSISGLLVLASALAIVLGLTGSTALARRRHVLALLLLLHAASQVGLLWQLWAMDDAALYRTSALAERLGKEASGGSVPDVVHGSFDAQFGPETGRPPDPSLAVYTQRLFAESFHGAGVGQGLRYPFVRSPEGLDSFYAVAFAKALPRLDDEGRLRLLEAAGVEYLLLRRSLAPAAARRVETLDLPGPVADGLHVYRLRRGADPVSLVDGVRRAGSMTEARDALLDPSFDPRREVVLPGTEPGRPAADEPGRGDLSGDLRVEATRDDAEIVEATTTGSVPSLLVVQRAWLPIWRATVDGEPAEVRIANGWQMAVAVPAGRHEVRLFVDRGPSRWALGGFVLALVLVGWLAFLSTKRPRPFS